MTSIFQIPLSIFQYFSYEITTLQNLENLMKYLTIPKAIIPFKNTFFISRSLEIQNFEIFSWKYLIMSENKSFKRIFLWNGKPFPCLSFVVKNWLPSYKLDTKYPKYPWIERWVKNKKLCEIMRARSA